MIDLLPSLSETIVLSLRAEEVVQKLGVGIENGLFEGQVDTDRFQMTVKVIRPTQFQPVLKGIIESSSRGSIIMLRYTLLSGTRLFLLCWAVIIALATCVAAWNLSRGWYLVVGVSLLVIIWWVVKTNLRLQSAPARTALLNQLS